MPAAPGPFRRAGSLSAARRRCQPNGGELTSPAQDPALTPNLSRM